MVHIYNDNYSMVRGVGKLLQRKDECVEVIKG